MTEVAITLGRKIKALRLQAGLTQAELASLTSKSLETISNFERGKTTPSVLTLHSLAEELSVSVKDFFVDKPRKTRAAPKITKLANRARALKPRDQDFLMGVIDLLEKHQKKT
jgi:transcriptional regulator with XRE-family HTH domain